ncbi:MAG: EamA family transporter [Actinomycetaceae bacterium]|nr:EamA family transporter [Actinomycetaceae bacterium]
MQNTGTALTREEKRGILAGIFCYFVWGLFPIYWKFLDEVNPGEIIVHRIIWSFVTTALIVLIARLDVPSIIRSRRAWRILGPAAVLITANWSIFIFAVSIDRIVETAIGYYLNPLVTILFGVIFFRERLTRI